MTNLFDTAGWAIRHVSRPDRGSIIDRRPRAVLARDRGRAQRVRVHASIVSEYSLPVEQFLGSLEQRHLQGDGSDLDQQAPSQGLQGGVADMDRRRTR